MMARTTVNNEVVVINNDHIHQHENTAIVSRHKPENQVKRNKMLYLADTILWSRDMDNYNITVVQT